MASRRSQTLKKMPAPKPMLIAACDSALAIAQANIAAAQFRPVIPKLAVEMKIIKTTGDKLQSASLAQADGGTAKRFVHEGI
jgi:porphobilinogen deaminase